LRNGRTVELALVTPRSRPHRRRWQPAWPRWSPSTAGRKRCSACRSRAGCCAGHLVGPRVEGCPLPRPAVGTRGV